MTLAALLRSDLLAAGFTVAAIDSLLGPDAAAALLRGQRVPARRALARLRRELRVLPPIAVLTELFVLGLPVARSDAERALAGITLDGARELGLVASAADGRRAARAAGDDDSISPLVDVRPYSFTDSRGDGQWWIASDLGELATGAPLHEDHVLGVGGASLTLCGLAFQSSVDSVLDLGTGCGIQAMHASRHARRVVATDISRRALFFASLNARLNLIESIEFRLGSLYEPVAGERFDRIITNPPFVITPRRDDVPAYEYRDGGVVGDAIVEAVVTGAAAHLEPGGTAQLLGNWEYRADADGRELSGLDRAAGWASDADLDHWFIEREIQNPAEYSETWIRDGGTRPGRDFDRLYDAWLDDFAQRRVSAVGFGYIVLRRPADAAAPTLRRTEQLLGALGDEESAIGVHLEECIAAHDALASLDDAALAASALIVAGDVTEERHYWPGEPDPSAMILRQGAGFGRAITLDTALAAFVGACDGGLSVTAIVGALAQLLEVDEQSLHDDLLPAVRALAADGILRLPA